MNVTLSQITVLAATVMSMITESLRGSSRGYHRPGMSLKQISEIANDASIELISDHALIRHQYHRRMRTRPVPAPMANRNFHAPSTDDSCQVTSVESRNSTTVARRDMLT